MKTRFSFLPVAALFAALFCLLPHAAATPSAPSGLNATVNGGEVNLSWGAVSGAISYSVARGTVSGGPYTAVNSWVANITSYVDSPPSAATFYYVVTATDTTGTSGYSNEVSAAILAPTAAPGAIAGLTATAQTGKVVLNWLAATGSSRAATYNLKRSLTSGGPYVAVVSGLTSTSYVNTGLTNGTTYYYVVSGVNALGGGPNSAEVVVTPVAAPADGTVSFVDDWAADPVKGGWGSNQVVAANRMQRDVATTTAHGLATARVEVRPGDDPINASGERAEVLNMKSAQATNITEDGSSGTVYYAMSYMLPGNWQNPVQSGVSSWSIPFQLHGPDATGSPSVALYANSKFQVSLNGGDLGTGSTGPYFKTYDFNDGGALNLGTWTDLVMRVTFAQTPTGRLTVWRRNQGLSTFTLVVDVMNVPTLQYVSSTSSTAGPHYWKHGLYRQKSTTLTNVLREGPLARGTSFAAVEWAAFATTGGDPGDTIPAFTTQPQSQTAAVSRGAQFTSAAFGTAPVTYQWFFNGAPLSESATVAGSTTPTLTLTSVRTNNQGTYTVVATNIAGSTSSNAAILTVDASAPNGTIASDPFTDGSVTNGYGGDLLGLVYIPSSATIATADDSAGIGSGNALQVSPTGNFGKVFAQFNDVTLANAGDFVQLQFDVRYLQQAENGFTNFRFGLYQGFATPPTSVANRSDDVGYGCYTNPGAASSTGTKVFSEAAGDDALGGTLVAFTPSAASVDLGTTKHTGTLRLTRQGNGDLVVNGKIDNASVSATHPAASVLAYTFNELGIGNASTAKPFALDNIVVTTNPDLTGPAGGTMTLVPASPVDAGAGLTVSFAGWTDLSPPLTYAVLVDNAVVSAQGAAASRSITSPTTAGPHTLKGRIYDAFNNVTEVTQNFTVLTPQESWRQTYFGTTSNTGNAADTADPDGDGQNNLFEFVAGLVPTSADSRFVVRVEAVPGQPTQKAIVFSPVIAGRTYLVKSKGSLTDSTWTTLPNIATVDSGTERTVTDLNASSGARFYIVEIVLQ